MNVIGIDPSLTATGIAHASGYLSTVKTKPKHKDGRLFDIYSAIDDEAWRASKSLGPPPVAVIEDLPKQAMGAGITGMVQGVVRRALIEYGIP